jgi:hypothetical protein
MYKSVAMKYSKIATGAIAHSRLSRKFLAFGLVQELVQLTQNVTIQIHELISSPFRAE